MIKFRKTQMDADGATRTRFRRRAGIALVACLSMLASGCAVTPQTRQSLASYVHASDQVRLTADELITDYSKRTKAEIERERLAHTPASFAPEYPPEFFPPGDPKLAETPQEKALTQTRQALVVSSMKQNASIGSQNA